MQKKLYNSRICVSEGLQSVDYVTHGLQTMTWQYILSGNDKISV